MGEKDVDGIKRFISYFAYLALLIFIGVMIFAFFVTLRFEILISMIPMGIFFGIYYYQIKEEAR